MRFTPAVLSAALAFATALTGCTPVQNACKKAQSCDALGNQTESQCESKNTDCINGLNKGASACQKIASDLNALYSCDANLSCDDLKADNENGKCDSQLAALLTDEEAAANADCDTSACQSGD